MEKNFKRTTVTAALPYANGGVHIGHLAGVYVPADIYVRYLRLKKKDVIFIGGSDEHGVPVTIRARKEGITVQEVTAITSSSKSRLPSLASRSTSTVAPPARYIISLPATSSANCTTMASWRRLLKNNIATR